MKKKLYLQDVVDATMQGILSLFVAEIQDALQSDKLSNIGKIIATRKILNEWIKECKLTPEKVTTIPDALTKKFMKGEVGFDALLHYMKE